ncbi:hypothetical protein R6Q57_005695 [Mikania cordata]
MVKPTQTNAEDVEYIPPMGDDDIEKDYQEFAASVEISNSKKRHRVNAPNTSHKLATKENQSKARITMAELISSTKGIHKQNEVFKQVVAKPNCITRKRAKRRLVLIDGDDEEDDERFPTSDGTNTEVDGWKDEENYGDIKKLEGYIRDTSKFKKRGPTMMHLVHMQKFNEREVIICNEFGQPIGLVTKEKDIAALFSRFLGTLARNNSYASLVHSSWHKVPHKEKIRYYVLNRCLRAKEICMSEKSMHTAGPKSFPRIRDEMKNEDPNKEAPTLTQVFEHTRKRTERRSYVHTYDNTSRKIEQMRNYKPSEDESALVDPFIAGMNKEQHEYRRLYGRGVINKLIKNWIVVIHHLWFPEDLWNHSKRALKLKKKLLEQRKEIEEDLERKKAELEAMQKDINNQRETFEATVTKLMEQLPFEGREFLT